MIVVAENEDICEEALRQLEIEWEVLPHIVDVHAGRKPDAPVIRVPEQDAPPAFGMGGGNIPPKQRNISYSTIVQGDIEAGFRDADQVIEYDLKLPVFASRFPNPSGSVAWWYDDLYGGEGKSLHIEGAPRERKAISAMYGQPLEKTKQEGLFMGVKYCDWGLRKSQEITPLLAKRTGRPVRCVNTREESYDFLMNDRFMHLRVGFKNSD